MDDYEMDEQDLSLPSIRDALYHVISDIHALSSLDSVEQSEADEYSTTFARHQNAARDDILQRCKSQFITLQKLYPQLLLPALDLLDKGVLTKFEVKERANPHVAGDDASSQEEAVPSIYYVKTSSGASSRYSSENISYEVRLGAWHCTCPSYTFSAFAGGSDPLNSPPPSPPETPWVWGGMTLAKSPPLCKHLLACVLAECGGALFEKLREVSGATKEELADRAVR
ncbi:Coproporphyrinogen-III oxidase [Saitoella coloradoensis]